MGASAMTRPARRAASVSSYSQADRVEKSCWRRGVQPATWRSVVWSSVRKLSGNLARCCLLTWRAGLRRRWPRQQHSHPASSASRPRLCWGMIGSAMRIAAQAGDLRRGDAAAVAGVWEPVSVEYARSPGCWRTSAEPLGDRLGERPRPWAEAFLLSGVPGRSHSNGRYRDRSHTEWKR